MSQTIVVSGRYVDHAFIPDGKLPDVEGPAQLVITTPSPGAPSIFDVIGKAPIQRTGDDIAEQIRREREEWGDR